MKQEKTLFVSPRYKRFIVDWTTITNSVKRRYSRTFPNFKELNNFIRKNPNRDYYLIREDENWYEDRENFLGFEGVSKVYCSRTLKFYDITDFDLLPF